MPTNWTCPKCDLSFVSRSELAPPINCACGFVDAVGAHASPCEAPPARPKTRRKTQPAGTADILLLCDATEAQEVAAGVRVPIPSCYCEPEIAATVREYLPRLVVLGASIQHHAEALTKRNWPSPRPIFTSTNPDELREAMQRLEPLRFVRSTELVEATTQLAAELPADEIAAVAGVARSGMTPAGLIAMALHVPLYTVTPERGLIDPGHGWRMEGTRPSSGRLLIVDDTIASGTSMLKLRTHQPQLCAQALSAVVFASDEAAHLVDFVGRRLVLPHYLEWNLFNSTHSAALAVDFDGILCEECPPADDDDGPRYARFLREARPWHLPRKFPVRDVITARDAKYEQATRDWLNRYRVPFEGLAMRSWGSLANRTPQGVIDHKASAYRRSRARLMVESCPIQAKAIAAAAGKRVICPATGEVHG